MLSTLSLVLLIGSSNPAAACSPKETGGREEGSVFIRRQDASGGVLLESRKLPGRNHEVFPEMKPPGEARIFLIGGSVAQIFDSSRREPTLRSVLGAMLPGRSVRVVDCGVGGADSTDDRRVLAEVMGYKPDLIILMTGVNEGAFLRVPAWFDRWCDRNQDRPWARRACRGMAGLYGNRFFGLAGRFEGNVRWMVREAKRRGARTVLCTLPVNMRDMPPRGRLPTQNPVFLDGWIQFERGLWSAAAERFAAYARAHPRDPMGLYALARSLDKLGMIPEAKADYIAALPVPVPSYNRTLRKIGLEEGAVVADVEAAFEAASPDAIVGRNLIEDDVHWGREADPLVTRTIAAALFEDSRSHPDRAPLARPGEWRDRWLREEGSRIPARLRRAGPSPEMSLMVFRNRVWEGLNQEEHLFSERLMALLGTIALADPKLLKNSHALKDSIKKNLSENEWTPGAAAGVERWWPLLLAHVGELHRRSGRPAQAVPYFAEALRLAPGLERARFHKALAHLAAREPGRADAELDLLKGSPLSPSMQPWIDAYRKEPPPAAAPLAGRGPKARETGAKPNPMEADPVVQAAIDAAQKLDYTRSLRLLDGLLAAGAGNVSGLMTRGAVRELAGDLEGSLADYGRVLLLPPSSPTISAEAYCALGRLHESLRRPAEAAEDFRNALKRAPKGWPQAGEIGRHLEELEAVPGSR